MCPDPGSNPGPLDFNASALSTELLSVSDDVNGCDLCTVNFPITIQSDYNTFSNMNLRLLHNYCKQLLTKMTGYSCKLTLVNAKTVS